MSIFIQYLRPALLKINELCYQLSFMRLCYIEKGHTYTLKEFKATQVVRLEEVRNFVYKFRDLFLLLLLWYH